MFNWTIKDFKQFPFFPEWYDSLHDLRYVPFQHIKFKWYQKLTWSYFSLHLEAYFPYFHLFDFIHLKLQGYLYSDALIISINLANNIIFWQQQLRHGVYWNYNRLNEKVGNTTRANPLSWLTQCHPRTQPPSTPQLAKLMFVPDNHVLSLHTANLISPLRCLPRNFVAKLAVWQKFIVGRDLEKRRVQGRSLNGRNNI